MSSLAVAEKKNVAGVNRAAVADVNQAAWDKLVVDLDSGLLPYHHRMRSPLSALDVATSKHILLLTTWSLPGNRGYSQNPGGTFFDKWSHIYRKGNGDLVTTGALMWALSAALTVGTEDGRFPSLLGMFDALPVADLCSAHQLSGNRNDANGVYVPPSPAIMKEAVEFWAKAIPLLPCRFYVFQGTGGKDLLNKLNAERVDADFVFTRGAKNSSFGLFQFMSTSGLRLAVNAPSINLLVPGPATFSMSAIAAYSDDWHKAINYIRIFFGLSALREDENPLLLCLERSPKFEVPMGWVHPSVAGGRKGGRKGGLTTLKRHGKAHFEKIGRKGGLIGGRKGGLKGGLTTLKRHGKAHFEKIGRKGARSFVLCIIACPSFRRTWAP